MGDVHHQPQADIRSISSWAGLRTHRGCLVAFWVLFDHASPALPYCYDGSLSLIGGTADMRCIGHSGGLANTFSAINIGLFTPTLNLVVFFDWQGVREGLGFPEPPTFCAMQGMQGWGKMHDDCEMFDGTPPTHPGL